MLHILLLQELVTRYAKDLSLPEPEVEEILETLRLHALQKLAERNKFESAGIATLKVRLAGPVDGVWSHLPSVSLFLIWEKLSFFDSSCLICGLSVVDPLQ